MIKNFGFKRVLFTAFLLLSGLGSVQAAFTLPALNIVPGKPDIQSPVQIQVDYVYNTGTGIGALTAVGGVSQLDLDGVDIRLVSGGFFNLSATIDTFNNTANGMLNINGTASGFSDPLLTGSFSSISQMGTGSSGPLEFLFTGLGGSTASLFGSTAGVILSNTGFSSVGDLQASFDSGYDINGVPLLSASANTAAQAIPEPGPLALLLLGGGMMVGFGRRKSDTI